MKHGIKAHTKLTDEARVLLLIARETAEEFRGARLRDGTELLDDLGAVHADAVVGDRDGAGLGVVVHGDCELGLLAQQLGPGERLETQLVSRIRGVGDEFAQEDLPVAVQGMDHQLEELLYLSLKAERFALDDSSHPLASRRVCRRRILGPERAMSRRPARFSATTDVIAVA